jgi:carbamoyltransferase
MLVLGLNLDGHDPSAALVADGEIITVATGEWHGWPGRACRQAVPAAAEWCLAAAEVRASDLDAVAASGGRRPVAGGSAPAVVTALPAAFADLAQPPPVRLVDHAIAQAAGAFYPSGFDRAAVLIVGGPGMGESAWIGVADSDGIRPVERVPFPLPVARMVRTAAEFAALGRSGLPGAADALIDLAGYGRPGQAMPLQIRDHGLEFAAGFVVDDGADDALRRWWRANTFPYGDGTIPQPMAYAPFAATVQTTVQAAVLHLARRARARTGLPHLVFGGELALNSAANGALLESGTFDAVFVPPVAADEGIAVGAALHVAAEDGSERGRRVRRSPASHACWGPEYTDNDYQRALDAAGLRAVRHANGALIKTVVRALLDGDIVAWFDGRAEVGRYAVGARSLLADPRHRSAAARVNRIRERDAWRSVTASLLAEYVAEYLSAPQGSPFTNVAVRVREEMRHRVPAIVHADGTARAQAVTSEAAPRLHALLTEFMRQTGEPVLLNCPFSVGTDAVVSTPDDAVRKFVDGAGVGMLVLGDNVVVKRDLGDAYER